MKVVQTTEFEVLGPLTPGNVEDIQQRVREHTTSATTLPSAFVDKGFYILLGEDHTLRAVHPTDYAAEYESVEGNVLDRLEEEFDLNEEAKKGELHTEEVWQFFEPYRTVKGETVERWWDGEDEQSARIRTTNGQVRRTVDIHVRGAWTYFEVQS